MIFSRETGKRCSGLFGKKHYRWILKLLIVAALCLWAPAVFAAGELEVSAALDSIWIIIAAAMVFLMHAGFAMVETGFTRAKNAGNIIMKNFMTFCGGSLSFILFGFLLMFGLSIGGFISYGVILGAAGNTWIYRYRYLFS